MELKNYNVYFLFIVLIIVSVVTFFIFQPFLVAILVAAVLSIVFRPYYELLLKKFPDRKRFSAFIVSILAALIILIPFSIILGLVVNELSGIYQDVFLGGDFYARYVDPITDWVNKNPFLSLLGMGDILSKNALGGTLSRVSQSTLSIIQGIYQGIINFVLMVFVAFISFHYFLVHGKDLVRKIMNLSPLKDAHENLLIEKFVSISRATIKGTLVVSFIQGIIGGFVFAIAGIPSATIWAVAMMFLSLLPMFGASLIWFPVAIIMFLLGNVWQGVFILIVGLLIISLIDNFLRPELVGKDTQMHPLIVFFATLGGIAVFGVMGFLIGPIVVALFISLWDIYAVEFKRQLQTFNK